MTTDGRRVLTVVGARPQFVKAFPVSRRLKGVHDEVLVHTGQHYDDELSGVFFDELDLPVPAYNLGVGSAPHPVQVARMMTELNDVFEAEAPDVALVYGDTNSTLAGALVASMRSTPLVHVEAGLRSGDWEMPEERNRVVADHLADVCCAPCERAVETLQSEGIDEGVWNTGDVMYDALVDVRERAIEVATVRVDLGLRPGEYVLATVHRAANTGDPDRLAEILTGLAGAPYPVVFPVHPRTEAALKEYDLWERATETLTVIEPVGYLEFVDLLDGAARVATDSGGVQKEALFLGTVCVTLREETEWIETVEAGWNTLVGASADAIRAALDERGVPSSSPDPYGDGDAAARIVEALDDA